MQEATIGPKAILSPAVGVQQFPVDWCGRDAMLLTPALQTSSVHAPGHSWEIHY